MQIKNICKVDIFYQKEHGYQLFLQIFSQVFEKYHKIRSFESCFGALLGALNIALLRAITIQSAF